jgi:hypothetical protein
MGMPPFAANVTRHVRSQFPLLQPGEPCDRNFVCVRENHSVLFTARQRGNAAADATDRSLKTALA